MTTRILYRLPDAAAVAEDGKLTEYLPADRQEAGAVFLGKAERMMPGLDCAFVDIGRKKAGFLPLKENSRTFTGGDFRSGDLIPVQIRKEETGEKGAFLSRDISLAGTYVILMPMNRFTGVSKRIEDEDVRRRLKETGRLIAGERFGIVMREASANAEEETIRQEAETLYAEWTGLQKRIEEGGKPGLILGQDPMDELIRDYSGKGPYTVKTAEQLPEALQGQLKTALGRIITIKGGGNLVIDRCEAMTVIDVNTGSSRPGPDKRQTVLNTNLEACEAIAGILRLRNTGGMILIDFIDMAEEKDRSLVEERLKEAVRKDREKTVIHGWTRLGLMEMTRKRQRQELTAETTKEGVQPI